jgi:hypothetical protein
MLTKQHDIVPLKGKEKKLVKSWSNKSSHFLRKNHLVILHLTSYCSIYTAWAVQHETEMKKRELYINELTSLRGGKIVLWEIILLDVVED